MLPELGCVLIKWRSVTRGASGVETCVKAISLVTPEWSLIYSYEALYVYISTLQGAYSQIEVLIWGKTKTGLTCKSTPLAPLVTCFSFTRMHLSAEKICWVTQSVFWVNSHVSCWAHLGMSWMARLWRVKCAGFLECLFEAKSLDI